MQKGEKVSVECKADGLPKPNIKWKSSNEQIFFGETLVLFSSEGLASSYECIADNGVDKPLTKLIHILMNGMYVSFLPLTDF